MLRTTSAIRESPPSSKRKTVGSTSRTRYVAKMKAEVTSRISETNSVSVPTGIKTLNRRIIEGPGTRITARLIILGIAGHPNRQNCRDENHLSRLSRHHAGGSACPGRDASFFWGEIRQCRQRIADLARAGAREIVFTSGATESDNLALKSVVAAVGVARAHIVTLATEHKAVLDTASRLEGAGCRVTILGPKPDGLVDLDELRETIGPETVLVSVMYANNEIGVLQPVRQIGAICREKHVLFHCDAVQAFGKFPVSVDPCHIDLMSVSAH